MEIRYLAVQEIIAVNVAMIQRYSPGEYIGVKDSGLLESAVQRPRSFGEDAYPSLFDKASALFESLGMNHPFQNANKRTAFAALVIFLQLNGYRFVMNQKDADDMTVDRVNHNFSFEELSALIQKHCVKRKA
ncbi:type II toxin-antitoxin system death-on-curing family toxin [Paenibacillus nasutitermitis]|uniref:Death-on-curing protein n=1 Tax=Paenibacillus nasutitermitis TaxID=1652958 RepID=A0A916ZGR5_9BACL|nr:type II toxin-antitoxin system death-on-curing family toxin [Paenibacillus nasutitermitis]GGD97024.1 death-on-curing protein [Paenibacillus nasutitermitis]